MKSHIVKKKLLIIHNYTPTHHNLERTHSPSLTFQSGLFGSDKWEGGGMDLKFKIKN